MPAVTWKASNVPNAFIALGDEVGKQTIFAAVSSIWKDKRKKRAVTYYFVSRKEEQ